MKKLNVDFIAFNIISLFCSNVKDSTVNMRTINLLVNNKLCFIEEKKFRGCFSIQEELLKINRLSQNQEKIPFSQLQKASIVYDVSPKVILALIIQESSLRPNVYSPVDAAGLTQLMPRTAKYVCGLDAGELLNIDSNVLCGTKYLKQLLNDFDQDTELALAAYNAGPTRVKSLTEKLNKFSFLAIKPYLPHETQNYVLSVENQKQAFV